MINIRANRIILAATLCIFFFSRLIISAIPEQASRAIVITPVVDLFIHPPVEKQDLCSPQSGSPVRCRRSHQALAHDIVRVIQYTDELAQIAYDAVVYGVDEQTGNPMNTFWIERKHLLMITSCTEQQRKAIPDQYESENQLKLTLPWNQYSFGTTFVRYPEQDTESHFAVYDLDQHNAYIIHIPRSHAATISNLKNPPHERGRKLISTLVRLLQHAEAQTPLGVVPYVLGGSSFTRPYPDDEYYASNGWKRIAQDSPVSGFDCSELVLRLAQMHGIPYSAKVTWMIEKECRPILPGELIEPGDIIAWKGHVVLVATRNPDTIIEARGYDSGYGKVHQLPLSSYFTEGITTFEDLLTAQYSQKPVTLLNKSGNPTGNPIADYKLLKLPK